MSLSVVIASMLVMAGAAVLWGRAVLVDEARYLRAVARVPRSRRVARLAGRSMSLVAQHHGGWRQGMSPRAGRLVAVVTRRTMRDARFGRAWTIGHRWLHRSRTNDRRVAVVMLALAATGEVVGVAHALRRRRESFAGADRRLRAVCRQRAS